MKKLNLFPVLSIALVVAGASFFLWESPVAAIDDHKQLSAQVYPDSSLGAGAIQPIPQNIELNQQVVGLGRKLFNEPALSENGVRCSDCHDLAAAGNDGRKVSIDIRGGNDIMNTPTLFNVGLNIYFTWSGRFNKLEDQIDGVLSNVRHMNGNWENILRRLGKKPQYRKQFETLFSDGVTRENVKHALADFERSLITPDAAFDRYLRGDETAISEDQKSGYELFKQYGCVSCHQGINIGGNVFARLGTFEDPFADKKLSDRRRAYNLGRYNHTGNEQDKRVFRVPSLRNVEKTAPYFHSGGVAHLEDAVKFMAKYQVGRAMPKEDVRLITEFLRSLTGQYKGRQL